MDIKEEVRQRIGELTRLAYERGYRDGAQLALAEIESIATDDIVEHLAKAPASLKVIPGKRAVAKKPAKASKGKATVKTKSNCKAKSKPKTQIVQEALQSLLSANGQARRDEVLTTAQAEKPGITKFDLVNGLRSLIKQSKVRVSPDNSSVLLPM